MKLLIALQYWEGDREEAFDLLQLLSETTEEKNPYADIAAFARFDTSLPEDGLLKKLGRSFNKVYAIKGKQHLIGHPNGCNGLWSSLVEQAYLRSTQSSTSRPPEWSEYNGVFGIEADGCPISKDWLSVLSKEWNSLKEKGCSFMGHWLSSNVEHPEVGHINGNAVFAMDLLRKVPTVAGTPHAVSWDTYHAKALKAAGWANTGVIQSIWNTKTINIDGIEAIRKTGAVYLHGVKDNSVKNYFRSINK